MLTFDQILVTSVLLSVTRAIVHIPKIVSIRALSGFVQR